MKRLTPIKAIRAKCLDCCCDSVKEVRLCADKNCPLYLYRMGHRPKEGNLLSEDSLSEKPPPSTQINIKEHYFDSK